MLPLPRKGLVLYGGPAVGKSSTSQLIVEAFPNSFYRYQLRREGGDPPIGGTYRTTTNVQAESEIYHRYSKCGSTYIIDRAGFQDAGMPIIEAGEPDSVEALRRLSVQWVVIQLWCMRQIAAQRLQLRDPDQLDRRLEVWDSTSPIVSDLVIDTSDAVNASREALEVAGRVLNFV